MNRLHRLAAALCALASAGAWAQTTAPTQSIEVRGALPLRTDVRTLCPDIDQDLHETLVKTVQDVAAAAVIDVRFELQGSRVGAVQVGAGPAPYQRMLKRAVRGLQCESNDAAPQQVAFRVRVGDAEQVPASVRAPYRDGLQDANRSHSSCYGEDLQRGRPPETGMRAPRGTCSALPLVDPFERSTASASALTLLPASAPSR